MNTKKISKFRLEGTQFFSGHIINSTITERVDGIVFLGNFLAPMKKMPLPEIRAKFPEFPWEMNVFEGEWAGCIRRLRLLPPAVAEERLATIIDTDDGPDSIANLLCDSNRTIRRCDPEWGRVLDREAHDTRDIGETKLVRVYRRPVLEKILEIIG